MKKIKSLILLLILCLTCSFVKQERVGGTFVVDFKQSLFILTGKETTKYTFNYGQKFVLAYGTVTDRGWDDPLYRVKTSSGDNYVTIQSKKDLPKLYDFKKSDWQLPDNATSYTIFPINQYLLSGDEFNYTSEVTDTILTQSTSGDLDQYVDEFVNNMYNDHIVLSAEDPNAIDDNKKPVINNYHGMFITDVNRPITVEEIKHHIQAIDDVDGDISHKIKIEQDNYTDNMHLVGLHSIEFSVEDNSHNKAFLTVSVKVIDTEKPYFDAPKELTSPLSKPLTIDQIKQQVVAHDNYDRDEDLVINFNDQFTAHKDTVGDYNVIATTSDSSNNTESTTIVVHVIDDIKPVISGCAAYKTSIHNQITIDTIKQGLSVSDNVDKDLTTANINVISDKYTTSYNKLGNYEITFNVTDKYNNVSKTFTVTITVEDKQIPTFYVSEFIINCDPKTKLSNEEIIEYLEETNAIDFSKISDKDKQIVVTYDGYNDAMTEGKYNMKLKVSYDNGKSQDLDLIINKEILESIPMKWYTKTYRMMIHYSLVINQYFDNLFTKLHNFFYNLFH